MFFIIALFLLFAALIIKIIFSVAFWKLLRICFWISLLLYFIAKIF